MAAFTMPALGADMETGKIVQWLVAPGARVRRGDVVAVVETHKGAIDVECFLDGVIDELAPLDVPLAVGAVLAQVRGADEPVAATTAPALPAAAPSLPASAPPPTAPAAAPGAVAPPLPPAPSRPRVSPVARRRAQQVGVDLGALAGTGAGGAVVLADVEAAAAAVVPASRAPTRRGFDPAAMRQAIATAMARSKREVPHYYLATTVDFAAARDWLERYNTERAPDERLLPAALMLKATALALVAVPQLNGFFADGAFRPAAAVHVGWAVALRGGGLVAPALHDADRQPLPTLMAALRSLVQRARAGGLRSSELTDATVTVTSLGDRGAESVLGVIYPPQVALIGFGRVTQRPWVVAGQVVPRPLVALTLAADHRASDGHLGGRLLAAIDAALQSPEQL